MDEDRDISVSTMLQKLNDTAIVEIPIANVIANLNAHVSKV